MAQVVKLSNELIARATEHAKANCRSISEQIELWVKTAMAVEANPDLPYEFVKGILIALEDDGELTEYKFGPL